jgi:hypothetical protein
LQKDEKCCLLDIYNVIFITKRVVVKRYKLS